MSSLAVGITHKMSGGLQRKVLTEGHLATAGQLGME